MEREREKRTGKGERGRERERELENGKRREDFVREKERLHVIGLLPMYLL